jgi:hypothetical protein
MSYKQFIQELEDDVSPVEAQSRLCTRPSFFVLYFLAGIPYTFLPQINFLPFNQKNQSAVCGTLVVWLMWNAHFCCVWFTFSMADVKSSLTF